MSPSRHAKNSSRDAGGPTASGPGRLPPRLAAVAATLPRDATLVAADVATGRGELALHLAAGGCARRVIAVDRSPKAVAIVRGLAAAAGLADRVEVRHGDGPGALAAGEADALVMAGIGGRLMRDLLRRDMPNLVGREGKGPLLVLQPQSEPTLVREWALREAPQLGYVAAAERLALDAGRYYHVLSVATGALPAVAAMPQVEGAGGAVSGFGRSLVTEVGPLLLRGPDPLLGGYLLWRAEALLNLAARAGSSGAPAGLRKAEWASALSAQMQAAAAVLAGRDPGGGQT